VVEPFRDVPPRTAASAFPRGLNGELALGGWLEERGEASADPGFDALCSELAESVLPPIGTVRFLIFWA